MRKFIITMLGVLIALPTMAYNGDYFRYTYKGQTLSYTVIDEDAKAVMAARSGDPSGDLIIPPTVENKGASYTVTNISLNAFANCSGLTSVSIPNSVTQIGENAFYRCSGLTKAEFASIEHLCSINFGNVFANPLHYANNLYINGKEITDVVIPYSVTEIGNYAFNYCTGLTSVTIPNSVTKIGEDAFAVCTNLTLVTIPNSVTFIGKYAFNGCSSMTEFIVDDTNCFYTSVNGVLYPKDMSELIQYPIGNIRTSFIIPDSVTAIGEYAFFGCHCLTSVTIPNSVTEIGKSAFYGCTGLDSVTIPNSVTSICEYAFLECSGLTSVIIGNSVTYIGGNAFYRCTGLTSVVIPNSVTKLGGNVFLDCTGLTSVTISNSIDHFPDRVFSGCTGLKTVTYLAEKPAECNANIFGSEVYENATLNYLQSAETKIATTKPWSLFKNRIGRDADFVDDSSILEVKNPSTEAAAVYDMCGVKVGESTEGLPKGIYIVRKGSTTRKIAI